MEINYLIEKIIGDVVNSCKDTGSITIEETASGVYLCTVQKFYLFLNNHYITISDTNNFNGTFIINNVDYDNFSFEITTTAGLATETGTYTADFPYYTFEKWTGFSNILQDLTSTIESQIKRFPRCFLRLDITENWISKSMYEINNLDIFFVINTEQTKKAEWRYTNKMMYLETFIEIFLDKLRENKYIRNLNFIGHTKTRRYYNFTQQTEQNKINSTIDAIELNLKNLKVFADNKCEY